MSSSRLRDFSRRLDVRLLGTFCALFIVSALVLFFLTYSLFDHDLKKNDHELIESKVTEYTALYLKDGIAGLKKISTDPKIRDEGSRFLVRLVNEEGKSLFYHAPLNHERFDVTEVEKRLEARPHHGKWQYIFADVDDDSLEILTSAAGDGTYLQVGNSSDEREDLLESLRDIFILGILTTLLLAAVAGVLFARRALAPVRNLVDTMRRIQVGNMEARVAVTQSGDELETLSRVFNSMLDKIQSLLVAMKETQDNVAHDLRTPITRFRNIAESALQDRSASPEKYREALSEGLECSNEIVNLVNTLMEINDADAGAIKLRLKPVNVRKVVDESVDLYDLIAEEKGIRLEVESEPGLEVMADELYLKRVMSNLLDNAIKYTDAGTVTISAQRMQEMVAIAVKDTGIGIEQNELEKVWDRLYRGDKSRSRAGSGLGLSLVKSVVKAHGGTVAAESTPGQGSVFSVFFPGV